MLVIPYKDSKVHRGLAMVVVLIVLAAMGLGSILLARSVYTTNLVAGNLAFQQAAMHEAESGIEAAFAWLQANNVGAKLFQNIDLGGENTVAYRAFRQDPEPGQTWEDFWNEALINAGVVNVLPANTATGNQVSYVIQRLCLSEGDPSGTASCDLSRSVGTDTNSMGAGTIELTVSQQVFYRITVRVQGPRNTVGFVQSVVAL